MSAWKGCQGFALADKDRGDHRRRTIVTLVGEGKAVTTSLALTRRRSRARRIMIRLAWAVGILGVMIISCAIILWNWPTGFYWISTYAGRTAAGLRLEELEVDGLRTPTLDGGPTESSDQLILERTPILFLHGWGTGKEAMLSEMRWFGRSRRVIAPDLPGFGDNPFPIDRAVFDVTRYLKWIEEFRVTAKLGRIDLVGESMGGALAAAYAASYPDSVRRLVLQAPAGVRAPKTNAFMREIEDGGNPLLIETGEDFDRVVGLCFVDPPPIPTPFKNYLVNRAISNRLKMPEMIESMRSFLVEGNEQILGLIRAPTLILYGDQDEITDASMLEVYRDGIANSHGVLIPGAGHVIMYDAPKQTIREIAGFLDQ